MKIQAQQLNSQHLRNLQTILISGVDEYLIEQSILKIKSSLKNMGLFVLGSYCMEDLDKHIQEIYVQTNNGSIFNEPSILLIRAKKALLKKQHELINQIIQEAQETFFIITLPKLTKAQEKQTWIKEIEQNGLHIIADPVPSYKFPQLIKARMQEHSLNTSRDGYELLASSFEGNLRAFDQEIEKLSIIFQEGFISYEQLVENISEQSQLNIFQCVDYAIDKKIIKYRKTLTQLKREKAQPHLILWAIVKELRTLSNMKFEIEKGKSINDVLNTFHIWQSKQNMFNQQLSNRSLNDFYHLLKSAKTVDESIKGLSKINPWHAIDALLLKLATST
jgi:DNA polymerase-3 subunit delta